MMSYSLSILGLAIKSLICTMSAFPPTESKANLVSSSQLSPYPDKIITLGFFILVYFLLITFFTIYNLGSFGSVSCFKFYRAFFFAMKVTIFVAHTGSVPKFHWISRIYALIMPAVWA